MVPYPSLEFHGGFLRYNRLGLSELDNVLLIPPGDGDRNFLVFIFFHHFLLYWTMKRTYTFDVASDLTRSLKFPGVLLILKGMLSIRYKKEATSILKPIYCIRERDLRLMGG